MKKVILNTLLVAVAALAMTSCNDPAKMAKYAEKVKISCQPEVLEVVAGEINATVTVNFPAEYFAKNAIVKVVPVIVYEGGEVAGEPFYYQGSKVTDNGKTVTADGCTIREKVNFKYVEGMEKSRLVVRATAYKAGDDVRCGNCDNAKKSYPFPYDIKIADGANTTYMLICKCGSYSLKADKYQDVIPETAEAQILYLINSSEVRNSQIKSQDIKDFTAALKALEDDSRRQIKGTSIVAYASPDGTEALNSKLSANREKSAKKAFGKVTRKINTGEVTTTSVAEDWEGFSELVNNSTIEDKDLILRVLSMYSDPNVREREIKNMSAVYTSLAKNILPQLRRARFITSIEYTNYTADELIGLVDSNIDVLDEEALLRTATLVKDEAKKLAIYDKAISKYDSKRAAYNAACVCLDGNKNEKAASYLAKASKDCKCTKNLKGVIAMREGKLDEAEKYFTAAGQSANGNLAVIKVLKGDYKAASKLTAGDKGYNKAVIELLNGNYGPAAALDCKCANTAYLKAVVAARQGHNDEAKAKIAEASKCEKLAKKAASDIEFAKVR